MVTSEGEFQDPDRDEERAALDDPDAGFVPGLEMPDNPRWFSPPLYGMKTYGSLYLPRQLATINSYMDELAQMRDEIRERL